MNMFGVSGTRHGERRSKAFVVENVDTFVSSWKKNHKPQASMTELEADEIMRTYNASCGLRRWELVADYMQKRSLNSKPAQF
jgi:hypothetical protein